VALFGPPKVDALAARKDVKGLIKALAYQQDASVRTAAAQAIGSLGDARAVDPLMSVLGDQDWHVREAAVAALSRIDDTRAAEALMALLRDWRLRDRVGERQTVDALVTARAPITGPLIGALSDGDELGCVIAAYVLAGRGAPQALPALLGALDRGGAGYGGYRYAAQGLGLLRSSEAVPSLVRLLATLDVTASPPIGVNTWLEVVGALRAIGDPRAVDALLDWEKNPSIWNKRHFYDLCHRGTIRLDNIEAGVVAALAACARPEPQTLVSTMVNTRNRFAALALAELGWAPDTEEERLAYALAREEWGEAGEIGVRAVEPLLRELGCEPEDGRWEWAERSRNSARKLAAIAGALGAAGDARAVYPLVQLVSDSSIYDSTFPTYRDEAAYALQRIGASAVQPLAELIGTPKVLDAECEQRAARALAMCGPEGLEALGQNLRRYSEAHRRQVQLDRSEPGSSHYGAYYDRYRRWEAIAQALVTARESASPVLQAMLSDEDESVRADAADLITRIGPEHARACGPLTAVLGDQDAGMRQAAATALTELGWQPENQQEPARRAQMDPRPAQAAPSAESPTVQAEMPAAVAGTSSGQVAGGEQPAPASSLDSSLTALIGEDHEARKAAIAWLVAYGYQDQDEPRTLQDLPDPMNWDQEALERDLREHPDFDVACMRAAYPTMRGEDHAHANAALLRDGVVRCRRKAYLLARLCSCCTWQENWLAALDYAVAAVVIGDPSQGPGDMVQVMELLAATFKRAELLSEAVAVDWIKARYVLGDVEAAAVQTAARWLAGQHAEEVIWAADTVREKLSDQKARAVSEKMHQF